MPADDHKSIICLGAIVGVHGIKGEVKVKSWTAGSRDIGSYGALQNDDGSKSFALKVMGQSKDLLRCKIKGVDNRNDAEALIGTALYIGRDKLPCLEEEEYYQADLIGLKVIEQADGKEIGKVSGVYNFGAGDILEIMDMDDKNSEMIPFTHEYVPEVKVKEGYVMVSSSGMNFAHDDNSHAGCADVLGLDSESISAVSSQKENADNEPNAGSNPSGQPQTGRNKRGELE